MHSDKIVENCTQINNIDNTKWIIILILFIFFVFTNNEATYLWLGADLAVELLDEILKNDNRSIN
jgi:hypothetical protein